MILGHCVNLREIIMSKNIMHVFKYINTTRGNAYCKFIFKKFSKGKHANHKRFLFRTGVSWQKITKLMLI